MDGTPSSSRKCLKMRRELRLMPQRQVVLNLVLGALLNFPAIAIGGANNPTADKTKDCFCDDTTAVCHGRTCATGDVYDGCGCWNNNGNGRGSEANGFGWNTKKNRCKKGQTTDKVASWGKGNEVESCGFGGWSNGPVVAAGGTTTGGRCGCQQYRNGAAATDNNICRKNSREQGKWLCMPANSGDGRCPGDHTKCISPRVPAVDCTGGWAAWGACSKVSCGGGTRTRKFWVWVRARPGR